MWQKINSSEEKALVSLHLIASKTWNVLTQQVKFDYGCDYSLVSECFYVVHETPAALLSLASGLPKEASGVDDVPEEDG